VAPACPVALRVVEAARGAELPQPSHQLDEAAAALFPGLQRRLEELKAEAAKREEMLAGL
jgi:hypothetical protein